MRVTSNMIINTAAFNTHRSIARFLEMLTQMSSGRRINSPSDDPVGTIRNAVEDFDLMKLLTELATLENNYQPGLVASAKIAQPTLLDFMK